VYAGTIVAGLVPGQAALLQLTVNPGIQNTFIGTSQTAIDNTVVFGQTIRTYADAGSSVQMAVGRLGGSTGGFGSFTQFTGHLVPLT
jgi:hypothetical protein